MPNGYVGSGKRKTSSLAPGLLKKCTRKNKKRVVVSELEIFYSDMVNKGVMTFKNDSERKEVHQPSVDL